MTQDLFVTQFTPFSAAFGGFLIGLSAVLLMLFHGRIAGMTGVCRRRLAPGRLGLAMAGRHSLLALLPGR